MPLVVEPRLRGILAASVDKARAQHASAADTDRQQGLFERYAVDPLRMLDDGLVWIYSRDYGGKIPFDAFDYQRQALAEWIDLDTLKAERVLRFRDVHVEKTRQMGCTWVFAFGAWWAVKFHEAQGLTLSLKSKEIDDGGEKSSWKSLHGKIRYIDKNAPAWLREHAPLTFTGGTPSYIKSATRPDSAFIIGEGQTADPGRGGTFMFGLLDEFARVEWAEQVALDRMCDLLDLSPRLGAPTLKHHSFMTHAYPRVAAMLAEIDADRVRPCDPERRDGGSA
jgi:hypothetical protein